MLRGGEAQAVGQFLKIRFKEPTEIEAVSISLGRVSENFPRDPVIRLLLGDSWRATDARVDVEAFLSETMRRSTNPAMTWRFPRSRVSGFEIRLMSGGQGFRSFEVPEVNAHAPSSQTTPR
jgi:hypothetical protein